MRIIEIDDENSKVVIHQDINGRCSSLVIDGEDIRLKSELIIQPGIHKLVAIINSNDEISCEFSSSKQVNIEIWAHGMDAWVDRGGYIVMWPVLVITAPIWIPISIMTGAK